MSRPCHTFDTSFLGQRERWDSELGSNEVEVILLDKSDDSNDIFQYLGNA